MRSIFLAAAAAAALAASGARADPAAEISTGLEQEAGRYGTGRSTETLTVRNGIRFEQDGLFLYGELPWHRIEAPANVVGAGGPLGLPIIIDPNARETPVVREGVGDLRIGGGYRLPRLAGVDVALSGDAKLPTAANGLGTGAADLSLAAEASRTFGAVSLLASVRYTMPGDPEGYELRNSLDVRGGLAARLGRRLRSSLSYGHARSASPLVRNERILSGGFEIDLSRRLTLGLHSSAGLSDGSPDYGAGVRIGWRAF